MSELPINENLDLETKLRMIVAFARSDKPTPKAYYVDAILDAVIQSLPTEGDTSTDPKWNQVRSNTIREVKAILTEAKSPSPGSGGEK